MYERTLASNPKHSQAQHLLGVIAFQRGAYQRAIDLIGMAIQVDPSQAAFYCNKGNAQIKLAQFQEAVSSYDEAIRIKPDFADAYANRGVALAELREFEAAVASYDMAVALNPNFAEVHYNRGKALLAQELFAPAISSFERAISSRPGFGEAFLARETALHLLASSAMKREMPNEAIAAYVRALGFAETAESKRGFAKCLRRIAAVDVPPAFRELVIRAISEGWTRPGQLFGPAISVVKLNRQFQACVDRAIRAWPEALSIDDLFEASDLALIANDALFRCILEYMPVASIDMERFLTVTRRAVLCAITKPSDIHADQSNSITPMQGDLLALLSAIGRQCYINEYVFSVSDEEATLIDVIRTEVSRSIQQELPVPDWKIAALAAYGPLGSLPAASSLVRLPLAQPVAELARQQILEPDIERACQKRIRDITSVDDDVSMKVQMQYEENPYPRWVRTGKVIPVRSINAHIQQQLPCASFRRLDKEGPLDVLIAGCGTGQQSIESAQLFHGAKVLAVDLSLSSLGYALRKTEEAAVENIEYVRGDILRLGTINRSFDVIESVGVLHHMHDPIAGWRELLKLLRPGGFMRLGFYSELARKSVVDARGYIAEKGYSANLKDIRRCRQDLASDSLRRRFEKVISFRDYFGTSECRDLLFHVQEHRFTLLQLQDAMRSLELSFLGFAIDEDTNNRYDHMFPNDGSRTIIDNWNKLEIEYPDTFAGMYQFWVQRR